MRIGLGGVWRLPALCFHAGGAERGEERKGSILYAVRLISADGMLGLSGFTVMRCRDG